MGDNISLTDEQYTEYKNIISELFDLMPNMNTLFNEQGEKIGFVGEKIDDVNKKYQDYIKSQAKNYLRQGDKDGNTFQNVLDDFDYSTETGTYGWSNGWRDLISGALKAASLYTIPDSFTGGTVDFGSQIFGAEAEYSVKELLTLLKKLTNTSKDEWSDILNDSAIGDSKEANLVEELLGMKALSIVGYMLVICSLNDSI